MSDSEILDKLSQVGQKDDSASRLSQRGSEIGLIMGHPGFGNGSADGKKEG